MLNSFWRMRKQALLFSAITLAACGKPSGNSASDPFDTSSDCYSPTKELNDSERLAYIKKISDYAQEAEISFGIPAAAITAMAAVEGGYGQTRTALGSNNLFGWKYTSASAAGGRSYFTLTCQPSWDVNNKYVMFSSYRDAVLFVGEKLATIARYKPTTDSYIAARSNPGNVSDAVNSWVNGVADAGYNYNPSTYKQTIRKMSNNYVLPSWTVHDIYNTYKFSAAVRPLVGHNDSASQEEDSKVEQPTATELTITAPADGAVESGDVTLTAAIPAGTTTVKFYSRPAGSQQVPYEIASRSSAPYSIQWATKPWVSNGDYELSAIAYKGSTELGTVKISVKVKN